MARYLIPVHLPAWAYESGRRIKRTFFRVPDYEVRIDLSGDRDIEWAFVASRLPKATGDVLDFGCGYGNLSAVAVQQGFRVLALDLEPPPIRWKHPNLELVHGDLLRVDFAGRKFDFILNCSTVEHVGLAGRYGVGEEETDGDLTAMRKLRGLLKSCGKMLMTIPCGQDATVAPWHRVYGEKRLPRLLEGYDLEEECYWVKSADNRWRPGTKEEALCYKATGHPTIAIRCSYALGCFVLRP